MADSLVMVGDADELRAAGMKVVQAGGVPVLVMWHDGRFHAIDNRCPHMGFPLHQGDIHDGLLDCHWHHARFDITCGATLDPWADDVACYSVVERNGQVLVDPRLPACDARSHGLERLQQGLDDSLGLVIAKAVVELHRAHVPVRAALALGARHGATQRADGWQPGLSILSAMANVLGGLDELDRPRALVHALRHIARDTSGRPVRRPLSSLGSSGRDAPGLRTWFRQAVEVRDADGAERILRTLVESHGVVAALDAVLAAATDHRYADGGHTLDYAVKCAELADHLEPQEDPELAALLFTSLVPQLVGMRRMEETSAWRRPVDVAGLVADAEIPSEPFAGLGGDEAVPLADEEDLVAVLLADEPAATVASLVERLSAGASPVALADAVVTAAVERILRFGVVNETIDWDTVHHTLTYTNAVAEAMRRAPSPELFRAVLDGAMSVYLDRFLNIPPAALPGAGAPQESSGFREELLSACDRRCNVDEVAALVWSHLESGGDPARVLALICQAVLREDAGFHELQQLDIAWRRVQRRGSHPTARLALVAAARWAASQLPTQRAREQTFDIALRLWHGEQLHEA